MPKTTQANTRIKCAKALTGVLAALVVSGCVSQQSSLDFVGTEPVPVGVQLGTGNLETISASADLTANTQNNIPTKAPRPSANIVAQAPTQAVTIAQPSVNTEPAIAQTPQTEPVLALAGVSTQTPTANVISDTATTPQAAAATIPTPTTNPVAVAAVQPQTPSATVAIASLSPTVETAPTVQVPEVAPAKKKSFFEKLFAPKESTPRPVASVNAPKVEKPSSKARSRISTANSVAERPTRSGFKPKVKRPKKIVASVRTTNRNDRSALPGVKSNSEIFGIKDETGTTSNSSRTTQVAAVGSFGRLSPNGLRVQHSKVQVACLKPGVLRILKMVERHYRKKPIITSGYRSPKGNRRAGGARNSQHIFCKAVDIQVEGVSKWKLAKFLRTLPGRGGVGTYCRTKSVHFDIGSKRDWHHPCRKSSKRKRKKA